MASGQCLGTCLGVGKGEAKIHSEMELREDVMESRNPEQCGNRRRFALRVRLGRLQQKYEGM